MEKEKWRKKRVATIRIEPYLAEYIMAKYETDIATGGVKIPPTTDLYFCVWEQMSRKRANQSEIVDGNLLIHLPFRKADTCSPWKDPAYYNYLSSSAAKEVEGQIRRMFNFELHRVLLENEEFGRKRRNLDVIYDFIHNYRLKSISSDALLKNYYRFRNRLHPKKIRQYKKSSSN
ncbi:hypothetical protein [Prevotella sp. HUN102]|uniref:hypothetical protein n=1 Tax=Prevotella sp. HUN102 TaxID=1392486 RepID=UPI00049114F9|nr:hypothetical protein [Prevotella sp. HUN102]